MGFLDTLFDRFFGTGSAGARAHAGRGGSGGSGGTSATNDVLNEVSEARIEAAKLELESMLQVMDEQIEDEIEDIRCKPISGNDDPRLDAVLLLQAQRDVLATQLKTITGLHAQARVMRVKKSVQDSMRNILGDDSLLERIQDISEEGIEMDERARELATNISRTAAAGRNKLPMYSTQQKADLLRKIYNRPAAAVETAAQEQSVAEELPEKQAAARSVEAEMAL